MTPATALGKEAKMGRRRFCCKNCKEIWELPLETKVMPDQPEENLRATIWCDHCKTMSDYSPADLPSVPVPPQDEEEDPCSATSLLCISFRCAEQNCGPSMIVHIVWESGLAPDRMLQKFLSRGPSKSCRNGHPPTPLTEQSKPLPVSGTLRFS